jgi:hypothetical protein
VSLEQTHGLPGTPFFIAVWILKMEMENDGVVARLN